MRTSRDAKASASVDEKDGDGNTPLHAAVDVGDPEMIELLLANGANVNLTQNQANL